jgi:hypothetical protein
MLEGPGGALCTDFTRPLRFYIVKVRVHSFSQNWNTLAHQLCYGFIVGVPYLYFLLRSLLAFVTFYPFHFLSGCTKELAFLRTDFTIDRRQLGIY